MRHILDHCREGESSRKLRSDLSSMVLGQPEAIDAVVSAFRTFSVGTYAGVRPQASFMFLGPTGTGKTCLVESLAKIHLGESTRIIKIDCAEFQHSHEIARIIGSPPGYLGHRETQPTFTQDALDSMVRDHIMERDPKKVGIILFDEIEKASDALWNLLLGILDKGVLTLGDNRRVHFNQTVIFMTSNVGSYQVDKSLNPDIGFSYKANELDVAGKVKRISMEALRKKFTPEFLNRIDYTVQFNHLTTDLIRGVLDLEMSSVRKFFHNERRHLSFDFDLHTSAREFVIGEGYDRRYGARHLKRSIRKLVTSPICNMISSGEISDGDRVFITHNTGDVSLTFELVASLEEAMINPPTDKVMYASATSISDLSFRRHLFE